MQQIVRVPGGAYAINATLGCGTGHDRCFPPFNQLFPLLIRSCIFKIKNVVSYYHVEP
jgi:hypothetical protein